MKGYRPKLVEGRVNSTGWPIDGYVVALTLWDYDNYEMYHLFSWPDESDDAMMRTMYQTEEEAGFLLADSLEECEQQWKAGEWEAQGSFYIPLDKVEVIKVIWEEEKEHDYGERGKEKYDN